MGVDFFTTPEILYPNTEVRIRLIRARLSFCMVSDNPNGSLGIVDCSLYTRRIGLKKDCHMKKKDILAYIPVEYNYMETLEKTFTIPSSQNEFIQEKIFNNAPFRRITIAINTNFAFTENPFWYQQFVLRQIKKLKGGQPIVDYGITNNFSL